jgi:hypothetical protein
LKKATPTEKKAAEARMNTVRTIPWEAVVEGHPRPRARSLPLAISRSFQKRSGRAADAALLDAISTAFATGAPALVSRPLSRPARGPRPTASTPINPSLVEILLPDGSIAVLTAGGSAATLQLQYHPPTSRPQPWRDALLRTHVLRHARLDPDARAFVTPADDQDPDVEEDMRRTPRFEFRRPETFGFTRSRHGYHWTASGLFACDKPHDPSRPARLTRPRFHDCFDDPTPTAADRGDPARCLPQLRHLRSLAQTQGESPCWDLAVALGRCRLFGVTPPPADDFTLSTLALHHVLKQLAPFVAAHDALASNLESEIDRQGPHRAQTLALELLEARMDLWCAYLAADEAYAAAMYDGAPALEYLGKMMRAAAEQIENYDANLERQSPLLTPAAGTLLLTNWRRLLAPPYREHLPWWLDGSLESAIRA